jgi:hypothetical protein
MIFIFPVPLWFVWCFIAGGLVCLIWEMIDDAELNSVPRYPEKSPEQLAARAENTEKYLNAYKVAEAERLLKRLAGIQA